MKELSIEEKASRYDEAIDKAKKWYNAPNIDKIPTYGNRIIEEIFSELKESEDEKIRKELIAIFKGEIPYTSEEDAKRYIAWLEKQGEKPAVEMKTPEESLGIDSKTYNEIVDECIYGEQKPADKVKPKFKIGDWVIVSTSDGEKVVQIDSIEYFKSGEPRYITSEGRWFGNGTKAHLWTIKDAKDGDVLSYRNGQWIFILKRIIDKDSFEYYTLWSTIHNDLTINDSAFSLLTNSIYPAIKEERDLLFQKMKEMGYEWDTEKKELNKIKESEDEIIKKELIAIFKGKIPYTSEEDAKRYIAWLEKQGVQKPQRMISAEAKEAMYDKPAWSEEDERILNGLISSLVRIGANTRTDSTSINYTFSKEINWLKSLKEKMKGK